jgi:hypothetical protein
MAPIQGLTRKILGSRHFGEQRLSHRGGGDVEPRQHPTRRALENLDELGLLDQLGHDLHGARPGADDRDAFTGEIVVVIPSGAVDGVAFVGVQATDVG